MRISINCPPNLDEREIIKSLQLFIENPYELMDIINKKRKRNNVKKIIEITPEIYAKLKSFSKNKIELIIESIITQRNDELYYGSILFKDKNLWEREKITPVGRIDGFNRKEKRIVELKFISGFKAAAGQVMSYGYFYPTFQKEIWLLMDKKISEKKKNLIKDICHSMSIFVKFIDIEFIFH